MIHSVLRCVKDGNKKTVADAITEIKNEISEYKEFYSTFVPYNCFDSMLNAFEDYAQKNANIILKALSNIFKINIIILARNAENQYFLKDETHTVSPERIKQSRERITLTVNDDGHYYPLTDLQGTLFIVFG